MKVVDSITLRCIAHATEDFEKVLRAMSFVAGTKNIEVQRAKGYHGNEIKILTVRMTKSSDIKTFWSRMKEFGVTDYILPRLWILVDDSGNMHLRFDKQEAYLGRISITSSGDTIAMRTKLVSYPWKKEKAIENFKEFISLI